MNHNKDACQIKGCPYCDTVVHKIFDEIKENQKSMNNGIVFSTPSQSEEVPPEHCHNKHGWDMDEGVYYCSDGTHLSWWRAIQSTPEWKQWYNYASKNHLYDVDECQECGWMSAKHAKDFMNFMTTEARQSLLHQLLEQGVQDREPSHHNMPTIRLDEPDVARNSGFNQSNNLWREIISKKIKE